MSAFSIRAPASMLATLILLGTSALGSTAGAQGTGTIRGRVLEAESNNAAVGAQVIIVGTRLGAVANNAGVYIIQGAPAGTHTLRAVRLGYEPKTQSITVTSGGEATADFTLARAAIRLDEVVTTATGEQSRRAIGNTVATIRTDSVAAVAPVTGVHEVLSGRVAGVQVLNGWGMTGTTPNIRIRGANSISLTNEPLWIIDGVRVDNSNVLGNFAINPHNRASTFNPGDVESIDVVKGPSAAALYGTAAANGVIIVKTKRGQSKGTTWTAYGEYGRVSQPAEWTDNYRSWGHALNASGQPTGNPIQCRISNFALKTCAIDSLTSFNPLANAETSPYNESTPRKVYGLQLAGGTERFTYFLSGEREQETGPYSMPEAEVKRITELRGTGPRSYEINPNALEQTGVRGNFSMGIGGNATLTATSGYFDRELRTPFEGSFFQGIQTQGITAPGFRTQFNGYAAQFLGDMMTVYQPEREHRFVGSLQGAWTPKSWLTTRALVGLDQASNFNTQFTFAGEGTNGGWGSLAAREGGRQVNRHNASKYSVDLGATASYDFSPTLNSKTSMGGQWFRDAFYQTAGSGYGLPPGVSTVNSASSRAITETTTENATYGAFLEEVIAWRDKLFITGGARIDQNSAFGLDAANAIYPRGALSWVLSEEDFFPKLSFLSRMRLRGAYGSAGVQPGTTAALEFLSPTTTVISGAETPALRLTSVGNRTLKPEKTAETEFGTDMGFWNDRINLEATYFIKKSTDALIQRTLPPSLGAGANRFENIGAVENKGFELSIDAQAVRTRLVSLSFRVNGSQIKNKILDLGGVPATVGITRNVEGYPIRGIWSRPILSFSDANGDGILTDTEITVGDSTQFKGSSLPEREAGLTTTLGLFDDKVSVSAQLDYRGHFYNEWGGERDRCVGGNCRAVNVPDAPLADQAAAVAVSSPRLGQTQWGYFVRNDFIRFRELSVAYRLPTNATRLLHAKNASLVLSGRNLGVPWTKFPGIDPEMNGAAGNNANWSPPPIRYFIGKVNVSF